MATDTQLGRRRWLVWLASSVAALVLVGGVLLAIFWPFTSQKVIAALEEDWPGKITVQKSHSTYFPHPGCVLERMEFRRDDNPANPPIVAIQKVTIAANYHDLGGLPGYWAEIILE